MYSLHLKRVYCQLGHTREDGQLQSDDNCKLDAYTSRGVGVSGGIKGMVWGELGLAGSVFPQGPAGTSGGHGGW